MRAKQALDGEGALRGRVCFDRAVDDAIAPDAQDLNEFEGVAVDERAQRRVSGRRCRCGGFLGHLR